MTNDHSEMWVPVPRYHFMYWVGFRWRLQTAYFEYPGSSNVAYYYSSYRTLKRHARKELEKRYDVPQSMRR